MRRVHVLAVAAALLFQGALTSAVRAAEPVTEKIKLAHAEPNGLVRLFVGKAANGRPDPRKDEKGWRVVPAGIRGILGYPGEQALFVQGTSEAIELFKRGVRVADVRRDSLGNGRVRVVLSPGRQNVDPLARGVRALPGAGQVEVKDSQVTLEGAEAWVDESVRAAIVLEIVQTADPQQP